MTYPDDSAFSIDDEALHRRLLALARHWLSVGDEAQDLVQDTWERALDGRLPSDAESREAWMVTVLRNLCIDAWRRQERLRIIKDRLVEDGSPASGVDFPERLVEQAQRVEQALRHLVRVLPAGEVAMVLLYEVFDYSHVELGALTGHNAVASRQQLHRILQRVRRSDPKDDPVDDDSSDLLVLCYWALAQRDPAGLVAVLRTSQPQAMALSVPAVGYEFGDSVQLPQATPTRIIDLFTSQFCIVSGFHFYLPQIEAIAELA
ncbi:RNA polymerase sigma factor [Bordetella genomosp. 4]|uniref:RNA polymerase subunit sigma n=1 Tax=Bordetella genomosp. 4 TaxID=463044 RepID=A0A261UUF4_9BORD|nr:RNA polymerase sigma factor [Bordetella genomosp. 4]OZI64533.1 RNA polymerase subunit sigma [Bordetella genomosp. 4]